MTARLTHIIVVLIATLGLLGSVARADLISMDFQGPENSAYTESGINTDYNGHDSLQGQDGAWNIMLVGTSAPGYEASLFGEYASATLKNGVGIYTSVSLVINTNHNEHWAHWDSSASRALQRDMVGVANTKSLDWQLSGLEASTLYRLRMFGREVGSSGDAPASFGSFTATGATSDSGFSISTRNYCDLWVKSTADGKISGILEDRGDAAAWSGMQIEWNVPQPVISIDFGHANPIYQTPWGPIASGTVADLNDDLSFPGQAGTWNELLLGLSSGNYYHNSSEEPVIDGLWDGEGHATTVSFSFNTGNDLYTTFAQFESDPLITALHRDSCYIGSGTLSWQIDGLEPSKEYTLKLFGYQYDGGTKYFSDFSATGFNTASGGTSLAQNYVDLVVTSTVSGQITGMLEHRTGEVVSTWSGIQIQGTEPFPLAGDLISIDFETADTGSKTSTASGAITDSNGDSTWGQAGVWNSLISGTTDGGEWQGTSLQPIAPNLFDGEGNATTVEFQFNTGSPVAYYVFSGTEVMFGDTFTLIDTTPEASWQLTGLQPYAYYTMRMFGQDNGATANWAAFSVNGAGRNTACGTNTVTKNYVDLTVPASAAGEITGKLIFTGLNGAGGASWSGMQILKLTDDPYRLKGTVIVMQ